MSLVSRCVEEAQAYYSHFRAYPSLRALFYRLVSKNIIPNTKSAYQKLSKVLTEARLSGEFPWHMMVEGSKTRRIIGGEAAPSIDSIDPTQYINNKISTMLSYLDSASSLDISLRVAMWSRQPNFVVFTLEKDALATAVERTLQNYAVHVAVMTGYSSTTQLYHLASLIRQEAGKRAIHILQLTDYDPSGEDIARSTAERLKNYFGIQANVRKVAVTLKQIEDFDLPHEPQDEKEIEKMKRDPRFKNWKHGLFRVELDALAAIRPDDFKSILRQEVESLFDRTIYEQVLREKEELKQRIQEGLRTNPSVARAIQLIEQAKEVLSGSRTDR